jgi:hypothetical protein
VACIELPTTGAGREKAPDLWIDPDLEPMYELERKDYERIINRMVNLLIVVLSELRAAGMMEGARSLAHLASCILADYDHDVSEVVSDVGKEDWIQFAEEYWRNADPEKFGRDGSVSGVHL